MGNSKQDTFVRWVPMSQDPAIARMHAELVANCPANLAQVSVPLAQSVIDKKKKDERASAASAKSKASKGGRKRKREEVIDHDEVEDYTKTFFLEPAEQVNCLLAAIFANTALSSSVPANKKVDKVDDRANPIFSVFFKKSHKEKYNGNVGSGLAKSIPANAHLWLSKFFLSEKPYKLRLVVKNYEEERDKFALAVEVDLKIPENKEDVIMIEQMKRRGFQPEKMPDADPNALFNDANMNVQGSGGSANPAAAGAPKWMLVGIPKHNYAPIRIVSVPETDPATGKKKAGGKYTVCLPGVKAKATGSGSGTTDWLELQVDSKSIEPYVRHKQQVFAIQEFLKPGFSDTY